MKTVVRGVSFLLAALLSVGVFAACGDSDKDDGNDEEKILSVEEIGKKVINPDNVKATITADVEMEINGFDIHSVDKLEIEQAGDLYYQIETTTVTTSAGEESSTETEKSELYQKKDGSNVTVYAKAEGAENWESQTGTYDELGNNAGMVDMDALFKSENFGEYDAKSGRYTLKEDSNLVIEGTKILSGYIECKDGGYTIYLEMEMSGMKVKTTSKYTDFGKASVKLPAEIAG